MGHFLLELDEELFGASPVVFDLLVGTEGFVGSVGTGTGAFVELELLLGVDGVVGAGSGFFVELELLLGMEGFVGVGDGTGDGAGVGVVVGPMLG